MKLPTAATRLCLALALLVPLMAHARNFAKSYPTSADKTFDAIMRLVQNDHRVHLIDYDGPQRLVHFRLELDQADPGSLADQFSGMYVLLQVENSGEKTTVSMTADRIFPPALPASRATREERPEESAFAKDFLRKLSRELKR